MARRLMVADDMRSCINPDEHQAACTLGLEADSNPGSQLIIAMVFNCSSLSTSTVSTGTVSAASAQKSMSLYITQHAAGQSLRQQATRTTLIHQVNSLEQAGTCTVLQNCYSPWVTRCKDRAGSRLGQSAMPNSRKQHCKEADQNDTSVM